MWWHWWLGMAQGAGDYNTKLGITILGMWFVSLELFGWIGCKAFSHNFTSHLEASTTILVTILSFFSFPLLLSPFLDQDRLRDLPTLQTIFDKPSLLAMIFDQVKMLQWRMKWLWWIASCFPTRPSLHVYKMRLFCDCLTRFWELTLVLWI